MLETIETVRRKILDEHGYGYNLKPGYFCRVLVDHRFSNYYHRPVIAVEFFDNLYSCLSSSRSKYSWVDGWPLSTFKIVFEINEEDLECIKNNGQESN